MVNGSPSGGSKPLGRRRTWAETEDVVSEEAREVFTKRGAWGDTQAAPSLSPLTDEGDTWCPSGSRPLYFSLVRETPFTGLGLRKRILKKCK